MITVNHPWHGAHYGDKSPQKVNALIEIPQGSRAKYEVDKATGLLKLDRVIYSSFHYPVNYGFIPQTLGQDNDPLDILVLCSQSIQSLCLVEANVIGNMQMIDNGEMDDKIIAVAAKDPSSIITIILRISRIISSWSLEISSSSTRCLKIKKWRLIISRINIPRVKSSKQPLRFTRNISKIDR
jgi:inorganic pyrophosphatase